MATKRTKVLIAAIIAIIIIVLIIAVATYVKSSLALILHKPSIVNMTGPLFFSSYINATGALTYNNGKDLVGYALVNYIAKNVSNVTMNLYIYKSNPHFKIYLLNVSDYCYHCFEGQLLLSDLGNELAAYGLLTNQSTLEFVNISNTASIPNDSIVIIPSGLLPTLLMPSSNSTGLFSLLSKGDTVIYIGQSFNRTIGPSGIIFSTSPQQLNLLREHGISAISVNSTTYSKIRSSNNFTFNNATFAFVGGSNYGSIVYAKALNGTIAAFSNYETYGWKNTSSEAGDIAKAIYAIFWMSPMASGSYSFVPMQRNGTVGIFTLATYPNDSMFSEINGSYALVKVFARNATAGTMQNLYAMIYAEQNGTLSMPALIAQTQSVPIQIFMNVQSTSIQTVSPHIDIYNRNMSYVYTIPIGFFNTSTNLSIIKYTSFMLPQGTYIAVLKNFYNKYYSAALFQMANVTIEPVLISFSNGTFIFSVTSNKYPISNASYSVELNNQYSSSGKITNGTIYYTLPKGTVIPYGNETFAFSLFSTKYTYSETYVKKIFHIPAFYIEVAVVLIVIIMLNLLLKAPTRDEYYIDVEELPPVKKATFTASADQIISVFGKVNMMYRWRYMPLTAEEVKNGISSSIRYNNIPVSITLQNAEEVLSYLSEKGLVVSAQGYYAPKSWLPESKHDIEYLAIFRKLRDHCVAHAMLFSDLDESDIADMVITKGGLHAYVIIYSSVSGMKKIPLSATAKWYIVFINAETRMSFQEKLYTATGDEAEALKMGIYYSYIKLVDTEDLDAITI